MCAVLFFPACDATTGDNVLSLGVVLPLTGTLGDGGTAILTGIELARDEVNEAGLLGDTKLNLIVRDNRSLPEESVADYAELIHSEHVPAVLGPLTSSSTSRVAVTADAAGAVAFSPTSSAAGIGAMSPWLFRASLTVDRLVPYGITVTKGHLGYSTAVTVVNDQDTFSNSGIDKITEVLSADPDVTIVLAQSYSRTAGTKIPDLTAELTAVKNASPDVIFITGLPEDYIGVITQAYKLGITDVPFICPLLAASDVHTINAQVPGAAEGTITLQAWISSSQVSRSRVFVAGYSARYGVAPGDFAASGYVATNILAHAIANAANYQAASIRGALAKTRNLPTIYGSFSFDEYGDGVYDPIVAEVRSGEFVVLQ